MEDIFGDFISGLESPATHVLAITPDDLTDIPFACRGINVATSGIIRVTTIKNTTADIYVAAGGAFPIRVTRIWAAGTTATGIVILY